MPISAMQHSDIRAIMEHRNLVSVAHISPHRWRFRVRGLRRSPDIKTFLEVRLLDLSHDDQVFANPLTGTLTILRPIPKDTSSVMESILEVMIDAIATRLNGQNILTSIEGRAAFGNSHQRPDSFDRTEMSYQSGETALRELHSSLAGLTDEEIMRRRDRFGENRLPDPMRRSALSLLTDQFRSFPVGLLAGASVVSLLSGGVSDAILIAGVLALNGGLGFGMEFQAESLIRALQNPDKGMVKVRRAGESRWIPAHELVVGDIVRIEPGELFADMILIETQGLMVDESALTGESFPVTKRSSSPYDEASLPQNTVFSGTVVTNGSAIAVVIATGKKTQIGRIQALAARAQKPLTAMQRQLDRLGNQAVVTSGIVCGMMLALDFWRNRSLAASLKSIVSLAIAAIPEGLPAIGTITLAFGAKKLQKSGVILRDLNALEALGAVQHFCLDKTGTMTRNRMVADKLVLPRGEVPLIEGAIDGKIHDENIVKLLIVAGLCNQSKWQVTNTGYNFHGSATENSLLDLALRSGIDILHYRQFWRKIQKRLRSEGFNYMATTHERRDGSRFMALKGGPRAVLGLCAFYLSKNGEKRPLTPLWRKRLERQNQTMAALGLRVLAFAFLESERPEDPLEPQNLIWLGLVGLKDPLRKGIGNVIEQFHTAGIRIHMITGDQLATAKALGQELELASNRPLTVVDVSKDRHLADEVQTVACTDIFAQVTPSDKLKIIHSLQNGGHVVAMAGDGINDSPALRAANIGVAMGASGTQVARDAADIALADDELVGMIEAIRQGRTVRANLKKAIRFLLVTNATEIMTTASALVIKDRHPFSPALLLWINLLTDVFPGMALALDPPVKEAMTRPPDDIGRDLFDGAEAQIMAREVVIQTVGILATYLLEEQQGGSRRATTAAFQTLASGQLLYALGLHNHSTRPNPYLGATLAACFGMQILSSRWSVCQKFLGLDDLPFDGYAKSWFGALVPFALNEAINRFGGSNLTSRRA